MREANYSNISKFHLGQLVVRKIDINLPKETAMITDIQFRLGGTITYELTWDNGTGGSAYEEELLAFEEREFISTLQ